MSVPVAYLGIILIWATTPLAIQWSSQGAGYAFAVLARMVIGVLVAALLMALWRIPFPRHARARRAYLVGGLGLFGGMALTYWGARYIHSGLVSVIFGLSPLLAGIFSAIFLGERTLTRVRVVGLLLAIVGLAVIFLEGSSFGGTHSLLGLAALLLAVCVYSGCLVWLKQIGDDSPPLATTLGTLLVSLPLFFLLWVAGGAVWPVNLPERTLGAILYLGVFGSVIGFALYYYVIRHLDTARVALITLITPVIALLLGHFLNGEAVALRLWLGTLMILAGLILHQGEMLRMLWRGGGQRG